MHKCELKNELDQTVVIEKDVMWCYDSYGDFITDFHVKFCPACGLEFNKEI